MIVLTTTQLSGFYAATDECGNTTTATQTITVEDTTAPTGNEPEDITIECDEQDPGFDPMFTDNCDDSLEVNFLSTITELDCGFQIFRTWIATDDCGNTTSIDQTVTIVDTTAPEMKLVLMQLLIATKIFLNQPMKLVTTVTQNWIW